jgi:hypothetical protein
MPILMQVMENYMPPPPAATCIAFHPVDNNIIAIGMEDSTIQIFNIQLRKVLWIYIFPCSAFIFSCSITLLLECQWMSLITGKHET